MKSIKYIFLFVDVSSLIFLIGIEPQVNVLNSVFSYLKTSQLISFDAFHSFPNDLLCTLNIVPDCIIPYSKSQNSFLIVCKLCVCLYENDTYCLFYAALLARSLLKKRF